MAKGYNSDNKITINNVQELNLIVGALQAELALLMKAEAKLSETSTTLARPLHLKAAMIGKLLDRLRVGWKAADAIPEEIQEQLRAREDTRFWAKAGELTKAIEAEISME